MDLNLVWGIIALICGTFMLVYGASLIRVVLAFAGFYLGFVVATLLFRWLGIGADNLALQLVLEIVIGAIVALLFFYMVNLTIYVAGGILGLVVGLVVAALAGFETDWISGGLGIVGAAVGGVFGRNLGDWLTILASALAGAYATVTGVALLFGAAGTGYALMPSTLPALISFAVLAVISVLAQMQIRDLRRRLIRR